MSADDFQKLINNLQQTIATFAESVDVIVNDAKKKQGTPSVITHEQQGKNVDGAAKVNNDLPLHDIKFIDELYEKFAPFYEKQEEKFDDLTVEIRSLFRTVDDFNNIGEIADINRQLLVDDFYDRFEPLFDMLAVNQLPVSDDIADVLSNDATAPLTRVEVVAISDDVLDSLVAATSDISSPDKEKGGGLFSSLIGLLGLAGIGAAGGGILAAITALPAALPGIGVALLTIVGVAASVSAAVFLVVKTFSLLKDDIKGLFPIIEDAIDILMDFSERMVGEFLDIVNSPGVQFITDRLFKSLTETFSLIKETLVQTADVIKTTFTNARDVLVAIFDNAGEIVSPIALAVTSVANDISTTIVESLRSGVEFIKTIITGIPESIDQVLQSISKFSTSIKEGVIDTVSDDLRELAGSLALFTTSGLLSGLADFFTKSPFEKIIDFQNKLIPDKLSILSDIAPTLENLSELSFRQLGSLAGIFDNIIDRGEQVSKMVEQIFSGKKGWFSDSGGILDIVTKIDISKQDTENVLTSTIVRTSDAQLRVSSLHLQETQRSNAFLSEITKGIDELIRVTTQGTSLRPQTPGSNIIDNSLPLQYTSTTTRIQMVNSGNIK